MLELSVRSALPENKRSQLHLHSINTPEDNLKQEIVLLLESLFSTGDQHKSLQKYHQSDCSSHRDQQQFLADWDVQLL